MKHVGLNVAADPLFTIAYTAGSTRSPGSTTLWEWATRVHIFMITGVSKFSDSLRLQLPRHAEYRDHRGRGKVSGDLRRVGPQ